MHRTSWITVLTAALFLFGCGDSATGSSSSGQDASTANGGTTGGEGSATEGTSAPGTTGAVDGTTGETSGGTAGETTGGTAGETSGGTTGTVTPGDDCPDEWFLDTNYPWVGAGAGYPQLTLDVSCDLAAGTMTVTSNGIPHYSFVAMTPNALVAANHSWTVPLNPEIAATPTDIPLLGDAGFGVNGSVWYGPNEGPFPDPYGDPVANAIMDWCGGHTAGAYHFHEFKETMLVDLDGDGEPACMDAEDLDSAGEPYVLGAQASPVLGYALDGFPIYGPYGCVDSACSQVMEFTSSWQSTGYLAGSEGCQSTADCGNPGGGVCDGPMSSTFDPYQCRTCALTNVGGDITTACLPVVEAWDNNEYVETAGDQWLDKCNGRIGPDGTYRYHATSTFPYIIGCYKGTPATGQTGGGNRGGGNQGGGEPAEPGTGTPGGNGPPSCTTEADCADACPNMPKGCTCNESPMGMICVPICSSSADCPGNLTCDEAGGICVPNGPPGG